MKERLIEQLGNKPTPFYYYDTELLQATLDAVLKETSDKENSKLSQGRGRPLPWASQ